MVFVTEKDNVANITALGEGMSNCGSIYMCRNIASVPLNIGSVYGILQLLLLLLLFLFLLLLLLLLLPPNTAILHDF